METGLMGPGLVVLGTADSMAFAFRSWNEPEWVTLNTKAERKPTVRHTNRAEKDCKCVSVATVASLGTGADGAENCTIPS